MSVLPRESIFEDAIEPAEQGDDRAYEAIFAAHAVSLQSVPLPTALRDRLVREGQAALASKSGVMASASGSSGAGSSAGAAMPSASIPFPKAEDRTRTPRSPWSIAGYLGWAVAAALALVAIPGLLNRSSTPTAPTPIAAGKPATITELVAQQDTIRATFKPDPSLTDLAGSTGEVVWNDRLQTGFMRLTSLPVNDPSEMQYQLWIVDPRRDKNPVDGGVFNIATTTGEVIVPIVAKLAVNDPRVFAITREQPGGVVVSAGPLALVASR